ncbi:MAG: trypsin-like peptidase domain-containing protein [Clostridiales bacterium]|nr:trypsin-like peptidase domain-containing protein [Clostridiales bacterium]
MKTTRKNIFAYTAVALAFVLFVVAGVTMIRPGNSAGAEAVQVTENATVVTSPFTEAVQKVHGSVVGVNNYTTYSPRNYGYGFNFGYGYGYGSRDDDSVTGGDSSRQVLQGTGSGVVVAKGYVLTNYHVVEDATMLEVTTDDKVYPAQLMGTDESKDIAVLYVDGLDLEPVVLGDSDQLSVGDWAICIGNPLSFTGTTTVGVISALNREVSGNATDAYGKRTTNTMIQTDAAINAGNSGGGMFNVAGELIGIPSMKYTGSAFSSARVEGIGMAIPINVAKDLINDVLNGKGNVQSQPAETGAVSSGSKPRLGVTVQNMNSSNYAVSNGILPTGAYVAEVESGSPAEKAGIQKGDIIVDVDGTVIKDITSLTSYLQTKQERDQVAVKVYRVEGGLDNAESYDDLKGDYVDLTVTLAILDATRG